VKIDVITIFPGYLEPLNESLVGKARRNGLLDISVHDLRTWTDDLHRSVDDPPYGGGPGMVMRPEPWARALESLRPDGARLVVPTPAGRRFTQAMAVDYALEPHLVFACGRYEGIDQRVVDWAAEHGPVDEVSIGDYVLAGGEVAVLVIVEALARLIPGVLGNSGSAADDSYSAGLLEAPSYTRPASWRGYDVPATLLGGDHAAIAAWRAEQSLARTRRERPDLLQSDPPA